MKQFIRVTKMPSKEVVTLNVDHLYAYQPNPSGSGSKLTFASPSNIIDVEEPVPKIDQLIEESRYERWAGGVSPS